MSSPRFNSRSKVARLVLTPAESCIYCGSTKDLRTEHPIPYSLGGLIEYPNASCRCCESKFVRIEGFVARAMLGDARKGFEIQSRRKREELHVTHKLIMAGNKKKKISVPFSEAPLAYSIIEYRPMPMVEAPPYDPCTAAMGRGLQHQENNRRINALLDATGAEGCQLSAGKQNPSMFSRLLWKIAYSFFWISCPNSVRSFRILERINAPDDSGLLFRKEVGLAGSGQTFLNYFGIESSPIPKDNVEAHAYAEVWTSPEENHSVLHCQISFLRQLRFPVYHMRIPNVTAAAIEPVTYQPEHIPDDL